MFGITTFFVSPSYEGEQFQESDYSKVIKRIADMKGRSSSKMKVFEPFKINQMELKNRMVVLAMVTNYCSEDGMATEKFIAYHEHKAKGGWGLIITEDYLVLYRMSAVEYVPGGLEIEESKILARLVEEAGADCIHC